MCSANSRPWQDGKLCFLEGSEEGDWGGRKKRGESQAVVCFPWNTLAEDFEDVGFKGK